MPDTTGWAIQTTRCAHLDVETDGDEVYAINLVMPWSRRDEGGITQDSLGTRGPAVTGKDAYANANVGDLLLPWRWNEVTWHVVVRSGGSWKEFATAKPSISGTELEGNWPLDALAEEIVAADPHGPKPSKTSDCPYVYSVFPDDLDFGSGPSVTQRSLPHTMAPLTHWPAAASNGALRLAGFIALPAADLDLIDAAAVVCFPNFTLNSEPHRVTGVATRGGDVVEAIYDNADTIGMCGMSATRQIDAGLTLITNASASQGDTSQSGARSLAARVLQPLQLLGRCVAQWLSAADAGDTAACNFITEFASNATRRDEWTRALLGATGQGFGVAPTGVGGVAGARHVLDHSLSPDQQKVLRTSLAAPTAATMNTVLNALVELSIKDPVAASPQAWGATKLAWDEWSTAPVAPAKATCDQGRRLLSAWLDMSRAFTEAMTRRQFMGQWLAATLVRSPANAWIDALAARLVGETFTTADTEYCALGVLSGFAQEVLTLVSGPRSPTGGVMNPEHITTTMTQAWHAKLPSLLQAPSVDATLATWIDAFDRELRRRTAAATPRPRDPGLTLTFETVTPANPGQFDRNVRGYAIALCAMAPVEGHGWLADQPRAQWITDTAAVSDKNWVRGSAFAPDGPICWMHETVGSTLQNGLRVTSIEYEGSPVAVMAADGSGAPLNPLNDDADGSDVLDFRWRMTTTSAANGRDLPLLGYGMHYRAEATCIDNAGGAYDQRWRQSGIDRVADLRPAGSIFPGFMDGAEHAPQWQYRSAVPPGAPSLRASLPATAYALSEQTRAHAFEVDRRRKLDLRSGGLPDGAEPLPTTVTPLPHVALLAHDERLGNGRLFKADALKDHSTYTLTLDAPGASAEFVERWLNTDITLIDLEASKDEVDVLQGSLSDDQFRGRTAAELLAYRRLLTDRIAPEKKSLTPRLNWHPAVSAIGVAVWVDGAPSPSMVHSFAVTRTRVDAATKALAPGVQRYVKLLVNVSAADALTTIVPGLDADGVGTLTIKLGRGSFARVRAYSLVEPRHFDKNDLRPDRSTDCRYFDGLDLTAVAGDVALPVFDSPHWTLPYRSFGPTELWFEAAPAWQGYAPQPFVMEVVPPGGAIHDDATPLAPALMALQASNTMPASWVRSLFVQRHEWHWTGYPVRLPHGSELERWLGSFAGVESYREGFEAPLTTGFGSKGWLLGIAGTGNVVVHRRELRTGARPARYVAFTARAIPRFRDWLATDGDVSLGPLSLELPVHAAGNVIPGAATIGRDERLSAPPLRWAVPLTSTYRYDSAPTAIAPVPTAHGNLLIFDTALRRTDESERVGGIGDTIEVDVLHTRNAASREIGVNPIFHANADTSYLDIDVQAPWGLTHDIATNALVAQTALVVTTQGAAGRWLLAKIRTRRLILPETVQDSSLSLMVPPPESVTTQAYALPTRQEGDDRVPCDFALDGSPSAPTFVLLLRTPGAKHPEVRGIVWPAVTANANEAVRFLCSWHKERWQGGGDPKWRLQVLALTRPVTELAWTTRSKASGYQQPESELPAQFLPDELALVEQGAVTRRPMLVRMSDYTDPLWLTFIGSFGREVRHATDDYWLTTVGTGLQLMEPPDPDGGLALTAMADAGSACFQLLLLYRPLADVTRGDARADTGALVAAYVSTGGAMFSGLRFNGSAALTTLSGCAAYLCTVQRITSASATESERMNSVDSFEGLIDLMFPGDLQRGNSEALMRLLPEYLGPIAVR